jgi:hypothetical protein
MLIEPVPPSPRGRKLCDDLAIRIDREGIWYHEGSPIRRKELVCLFASALTRDRDGGYWLVTPIEMGRIEVEDAPFLAVEAFFAGEGRQRLISLRTNVDEIVTVDKDHALYVVTDEATGQPAPYLALHRQLCAKLTRAVYYELVSQGVEETVDGRRQFGVWSAGRFYPLGEIEDR